MGGTPTRRLPLQRLLLVLLAPLLFACQARSPYPERLYHEVLELEGSHDGTGGLRHDVRDGLDRRWEIAAGWAQDDLIENPEGKVYTAMALTLSDRVDHLELAVHLGAQAAEEGDPRGNLAYAHAQDRLALVTGAATQPYGTCYRYNYVAGSFQIFPPVDPRVSDSERQAMGVPPLRELLALVEELNASARTEDLNKRVLEN